MYEGNTTYDDKEHCGTVSVAFPWALLQEQEAGFPGLEETMSTWSNTMSKQPDGEQFRVIAFSFADVPLNPRNITSLTFNAPL